MSSRRTAAAPRTTSAAVVDFRGPGDPPLLLRIPVQSPTWAEGLPPTPEGLRVTAAFSHPDLEVEHGEALALLGYHSVGVRPALRDSPSTVDLLIPRAACDRFPRWRDQLLSAGGRVWDLSFGPVAELLAPAVAVHDQGIVLPD
ncbi:MAG: hypothetical protein ACR2HR_15815 [Euzebya sp.]